MLTYLDKLKKQICAQLPLIYCIPLIIAIVLGLISWVCKVSWLSIFLIAVMAFLLSTSILFGLKSAYAQSESDTKSGVKAHQNQKDHKSFCSFIMNSMKENSSMLYFASSVIVFILWIASIYGERFNTFYPTASSPLEVQKVNMQCQQSVNGKTVCTIPASKNAQTNKANIISKKQVVSCGQPDNKGNIQCTVAPEGNSGDLRASLGAFGDYFGGILNPLIALAALIILLLTFRATIKTLELTKNEFIDTKKILSDQTTLLAIDPLAKYFIDIENLIDKLPPDFNSSIINMLSEINKTYFCLSEDKRHRIFLGEIKNNEKNNYKESRFHIYHYIKSELFDENNEKIKINDLIKGVKINDPSRTTRSESIRLQNFLDKEISDPNISTVSQEGHQNIDEKYEETLDNIFMNHGNLGNPTTKHLSKKQKIILENLTNQIITQIIYKYKTKIIESLEKKIKNNQIKNNEKIFKILGNNLNLNSENKSLEEDVKKFIKKTNEILLKINFIYETSTPDQQEKYKNFLFIPFSKSLDNDLKFIFTLQNRSENKELSVKKYIFSLTKPALEEKIIYILKNGPYTGLSVNQIKKTLNLPNDKEIDEALESLKSRQGPKLIDEIEVSGNMVKLVNQWYF